MSVAVRRYAKRDVEEWQRLVAESCNGTFQHGRHFLSYHGERFQDVSLVIENDRGRLEGVFPAALDPVREDVVVSHPGLTYGGVVHRGSVRGDTMLQALQAIAETYRAAGLRYLRYKVIPYVYHQVPSSDDLYALFRLGAKRYRCDLSAAIDLSLRPKPSTLRRRNFSKARRSGVRVEIGPRYLEPFWAVLEQNLASRHGTRPTHTLEEIAKLQRMFPEQIQCVVGLFETRVEAGIVLFRTPRVAHVQYAASTAFGNTVGALTAVMERTITESEGNGARYFDFGVSNEQDGKVLNEGLYRFKTSFGAGGVVHEFYELALSRG